MPGGVPVATFAIGEAGAKNAGLFAVSDLALSDDALARKLDARRAQAVARRSDGGQGADAVSDARAGRSRPAQPSAFSAAASWAACWRWRRRALVSRRTSILRRDEACAFQVATRTREAHFDD